MTDAQLVSVRRALRKLVREHAIGDLGRGYRDGRRRWVNERVWLRDTIRRMQLENALLAGRLDAESFKRRVTEEMLPLLNRARELGVQIS